MTRSSVTLTWKPSEEDGGSEITGYVLEYREGFKMTWTPVKVVAPDITSYTAQNLKEGQEYVFRVMAENSVGRSDALESDKVTPKHPFGKLSLSGNLVYLLHCFLKLLLQYILIILLKCMHFFSQRQTK